MSENTLQDINDSNALKNIETIEWVFGSEDYGASISVEQVKALLDSELPNLKRLGLKNSELQTEIVELIANHPILAQLEELDISMGILQTPGGQILLDQYDKLAHLSKINCEFHFIDNTVVSHLKAKYGSALVISDEPEDNDGGEWFYVEVGE